MSDNAGHHLHATHGRKRPPLKGAIFGLSAALLFGASMPFAKALLSDVNPFMLAGLFYLGSGVGLSALQLVTIGRASSEARLTKPDLPWLLLAIFFGGILAELVLMVGLQSTPASDASLLLNLEGAFGAIIAWIVFREHANARVVLGMVLLSAGAMVLSITPNLTFAFSLASVGIVFACLCWAIDNNLTRKISAADPTQIASIKGLVAGVVNITVALFNGASFPEMRFCALSMFIGFLSYGVSLVLYIFALRHVGAARSSAYFSAAPFIGAFGSILFLHEPVTAMFALAATLMAGGLWLHLTEEHSHEHTHGPEAYEHTKVHATVTHSHGHMPDIHHIHEHKHD